MIRAAPLLALGCGYPEEEFLADLDRASCDWQSDCYDLKSQEECLYQADESWTGATEGCAYDPEAARECVRDFKEMDCPADDEDPVFPSACLAVWDCP